jgi:NAD(P)-dependent dehydrogenase (short-subunit alcohol dehydrogenase family)
MSASKTALVVGATGVLGASLFPALREGAFEDLGVTALVRSGSAKAAQLHALGVKTVEGSAEDATLITSLGGKYDVVLNMADSSKPDITKALVEGIKARPKGEAVFLHITGTGNFLDGKGTGEYDQDGKFWDVSPERARLPPPSGLMRVQDAKESNIALVNPQMFNDAGDRMWVRIVRLALVAR